MNDAANTYIFMAQVVAQGCARGLRGKGLVDEIDRCCPVTRGRNKAFALWLRTRRTTLYELSLDQWIQRNDGGRVSPDPTAPRPAGPDQPDMFEAIR